MSLAERPPAFRLLPVLLLRVEPALLRPALVVVVPRVAPAALFVRPAPAPAVVFAPPGAALLPVVLFVVLVLAIDSP